MSKTRRALHEALVALIRERDYEEISVQEILGRADVGRSTFYSHYRDKEALLVSGIHDMIRSVSSAAPAADARHDPFTWFSLPILEHHERHRHSASGQLTANARAVLHERLRDVLDSLLRERMRKQPSANTRTSRIPADLLVPYVTSTFVLVLNWWLNSRSPLPTAEVHALFCSLIASAV